MSMATPEDFSDEVPLSRVSNGEIYRLVLRVDRRIDALSVVSKETHEADKRALEQRISDTRLYVDKEIITLRDQVRDEAAGWRKWKEDLATTRKWMISLGFGLLGTITYIMITVLH